MFDSISKRNIIIAAIIFVLALGGAIVWYGMTQNRDAGSEPAAKIQDQNAKNGAENKSGNAAPQASALAQINEALPSYGCNQENARIKAIADRTPFLCQCLKEAAQIEACQLQVNNAILKDQALNNYEPEKCQDISDEAMRTSCKNIAQAGLDSIKKSDPIALAGTYVNNGQPDKAVQELEALSDTRRGKAGNLNLAIAYGNLTLADHNASRLAKADKIVADMLSADGKDLEALRVKAFLKEAEGDFEEAIIIYNQALDIDPAYIPALVGRGHAYSGVGDLPKALADFQKAAELDKDKKNMQIYAQLCRIEASRKDLMPDAVKNCQLVLNSKQPIYQMKADSALIMADIYMLANRDPEARSFIDAAAGYHPNDPDARIYLGKYFNRTQDFGQAEAAARKAADMDPQKAFALDVLAYSLYQQGKYEEAIVAANKELEMIDQDISILASARPAVKRNAYYILANIYNAQGDKENEMKYKQMAEDAFKQK